MIKRQNTPQEDFVEMCKGKKVEMEEKCHVGCEILMLQMLTAYVSTRNIM